MEPVLVSYETTVNCAAICADGSRLAVACMSGDDPDGPNVIREYLLADVSAPCWEHAVDLWVTDLVYAGDTPIARAVDVGEEVRLIRCTRAGLEIFAHDLWIGEGDLQPVGDGFVAVDSSTGVLFFGTADSDHLRVVELAEEDLWLGLWPPATAPAAGLIAVGGDQLMVIDGHSGSIVAHAEVPDWFTGICALAFAGPDRLVTQLDLPVRDTPAESWMYPDALGIWRFADGTLTFEGAHISPTRRHRLAALATHRLAVTTPYPKVFYQGGPLQFYDVTAMRPTIAPSLALQAVQRVTQMSATPDGNHLLLLRQQHHDRITDTVEVHPLAPTSPT
jgi:hypothetical protein